MWQLTTVFSTFPKESDCDWLDDTKQLSIHLPPTGVIPFGVKMELKVKVEAHEGEGLQNGSVEPLHTRTVAVPEALHQTTNSLGLPKRRTQSAWRSKWRWRSLQAKDLHSRRNKVHGGAERGVVEGVAGLRSTPLHRAINLNRWPVAGNAKHVIEHTHTHALQRSNKKNDFF